MGGNVHLSTISAQQLWPPGTILQQAGRPQAAPPHLDPVVVSKCLHEQGERGRQ